MEALGSCGANQIGHGGDSLHRPVRHKIEREKHGACRKAACPPHDLEEVRHGLVRNIHMLWRLRSYYKLQ